MANRNTVEIILSARDQASEAMREAFGGIEESNNKFMGSLLSMKTLAAGALAALGGYIAKTGVEYDAMTEQSTIAWTTLLGSQQKAKQMIQDIGNLAKATPFETEQVDMMAKYFFNAGINGKALIDQVMRLSDVASAFNISADNAQELARQMSQVDQAGVAMTSDLDILQNQGIPIFKALGDVMHVPVSQVKKLASEGKITADLYNKAFDSVASHVKGASDAQSQTFNGMLSTLSDNLKMLTGALAQPIFDVMKKSLNDIMPMLSGLTTWAKGGGSKEFKDALTQTFGTSGSNMVMSFIKNVGDGFSLLKGYVDKGKQIINGFFDVFSGTKTNEGFSILEKLGISPDVVIKIYTSLYAIKTTITTYFNDIVQYYHNLFSGKNNIANSFISIFNTIKSIAMPILQDIVRFVGQEFGQIKKFWDEYGGQITQAVKNFFAVLAAIFKALAPVLEFIIKGVWDNIKGVVDGAIKIIEGIILVFTGIFTGNWSTLWKGIKDILGGAIEAIWNAINLLFIGRVLKGVTGFFGLIKGFFSGGWSEILTGLKSFVGGAEGWFQGLVDAAKTKFNDIITAAKNIPDGIVSGLKSGLKNITDGIVGLANELVKQFKKTLGINSPSKVFEDMGGHILTGLVNGLSSGNLLDLGKAVFKDFGGGIMNTVDKIKGFLQGAFSGSAGGNVSGWLQQAMQLTGVPSSWLGPLSTIAQHESGGNPLAENHWDSNQKYGGTFGLMQMIIPTFQRYMQKGFSNISDPVSNAIASINYIKARYGDVFNVPGIKSMLSGGPYKGYATGTNDAIEGWHMVGENGPELMYVPGGSQIKSNSDSKQMIGGSKKVYNVTVNSLQANMNEKDLVRALQRMEALDV